METSQLPVLKGWKFRPICLAPKFFEQIGPFYCYTYCDTRPCFSKDCPNLVNFYNKVEPILIQIPTRPGLSILFAQVWKKTHFWRKKNCDHFFYIPLLRIHMIFKKKLLLEWITITNSKKTQTKVHPHIDFWGGGGLHVSHHYLVSKLTRHQ